MNYFLHGEETYLVRKHLAKVKKEFIVQYGEFSVEQFKNNESVEKLIDAYLTQGLFISNKLIIYYGLPNIRKDYVEHFMKMFKHANDKVDLYIVVPTKVDKRLKLIKFFFKEFKSIEFKKLEVWNIKECVKQIMDTEESRGYSISYSDAEYLIDKIGLNLWQIFNDLERIETAIMPEKQITKSVIDKFVNQGDKSYFDIVDLFRRKDAKKFMASIAELKKQEEAFILINMLSKHVRLLMMLIVLQRDKVQNMSSHTGKSPYYLKKIVPDLKKWKFKELFSYCESLLEIEFLSKSGKINPIIGLVMIFQNINT